MRGLYIHIPFCERKCPYCDFNSYSGKLDIAESYVNQVLKEAKEYKNDKISTIYIGGGTPSLLDESLISKLLWGVFDNFDVLKNAEITIEVNPGTVDKKKLKCYKNLGINRLSIGVQSFNDDMLKILGRIHNGSQAERIIKTALDTEILNISADFMFSYKGQTFDIWKNDLEKAVNTGISHISCYGLKVEEGTPFHQQNMENLDEDTDRKMQKYAVEFLEENGFNRYEISNFAKPGKESRHNLLYWHCQEYIGLGAGAHSYVDGKRFNNILSPEKYIFGDKIRENEIILSAEDKKTEHIIMGMRLCEGIDEKKVEKKEALGKYIELGFIKRNCGKISFTDKGFDVSNYILSDII